MNRFDIIGGQSKAWSILSRSFLAGKVASTYLLHGPEGVGAWAMAIEFAALLNCEAPLGDTEDPSSVRPCSICRHCRSILALNFEGLHAVVPIGKHKNESEAIDLANEFLQRKREEPFALPDRSSPVTIPIDLARETKRRLAVQAPTGIRRVALFYQMDLMRASSADALLKLIEEPPSDTTIILTASHPEALTDTIQSRSQRIRLNRLPEPMIVDYLREHYQASEGAARLAARIGEGSLGRAILVVADGDGDGADGRSVGLMLFKTLMTQTSPDLVARMNDLINYRDRGAAEELIRLWQSLIRDGAYYANTADETGLKNVDFANETKQLAFRLADNDVVNGLVSATKNTLADLALNAHIQAALVAMALKLKEVLRSGGQTAARGD